MKRPVRLLAMLLWGWSGAAVMAQAADHVILISVDGLRPEFYQNRQWPAPMMQWLAERGAFADGVRGVYPTVTYPSHTTMITGARPAGHGIAYNEPFEPEGATGRWYWEAEHIKAPTLWEAVRARGGTTASVTWPVTVGAAIDYLIPELWEPDGSVDNVTAMRGVTRPAGLLEEIEREATGRLTVDNFTIDHMTREDRAGAAAAYLFEQYRPTLMTLHLIAADHAQHRDGREGPLVRRAVAAVDRAISQVYEAVQRSGLLEQTAIVVTGDHGFINTHTTLNPNIWLVEAGLSGESRGDGRWRAAFHCASASAFLHLRDSSDAAAIERVQRLLQELPGPYSRLFEVVDRKGLDELGAAPRAALALSMVPGVTCGSATTGPLLRPRSGGNHGYHPDLPQIRTGFIGWGIGIRAGARIPILAMEDIAAIIGRLLALDFRAPDGIVPEGLLQPPTEPGRMRP